jgi:hypothetical protein
MADYRLYLLNASGSIAAAHEITFNNHESAVMRAREIFGNQAFEVWQGATRVHPPVAE